MSMIICEVCDRDNWSGIRCTTHRVCTACLDSIVERYFEEREKQCKTMKVT